ncbi:hypothetical protein F9B85_10290 [Heliorestis acidaminivorans]|uniref:Uncharacterized protein n=1 Tax=Heliorestis acidaminivorans TaxID=553427 RepID=A0A6I0EVJ3_9FIRM|nr:hypothetical protein [Heliorestis acidaminivorans]KAB2951938.1 hypothetical protein F9B85_10290 [Heliorestis acidaminivorans]
MVSNTVTPLSRFKEQASVIFYLTDDHTGNAITNGLIKTEMAIPLSYVNKKNGYYVFTNLQKKVNTKYLCFTIEAEPYVPVEIEVDLTSEAPALFHINMYHKPNSNEIKGLTSIEVVVKEQKQLLVKEAIGLAVKSSTTSLRLVEDVTTGQEIIKLYSKQSYRLEGKSWLIEAEDGQLESFQIKTYEAKENHYSLEKPLHNQYTAGALVYPLWRLRTDEQARVVLPLPRVGRGEETVELLLFYKEHRSKLSLKIEEGKKVQATFVL